VNASANSLYRSENFIPAPEIIQKGDDITIIAVGDMLDYALKAAEMMKERKIRAEIINLKIIKPLNMEKVFDSARKTRIVITIENNIITGGAGEAILCEISRANINCKFKILAFPNEIINHMPVERVFEKYGMDAAGIVKEVENIM